MEAVGFEDVAPLADDALGAPAADIDDQAPGLVVGEEVGHAEVDQASLFASRDDLYGVAEGLVGPLEELRGVASLAEGVGPDRADASRGEVAQPLAHPRQAEQGSLLSLLGQHLVSVESSGQLNALAHSVDHPDLIVDAAGDDHVKAVRP